MFQNFKLRFFHNRINKEAKNNTTPRKIQNLKDIKQIGIVFDGTSFQSINNIHDFETEMKAQGKTVEVYGYINTHDVKSEPFLMSNKNLNWYGYPTKNEAFGYADKPFDVLFGIYNDSDSPLNAIFANSKARLRIGIFTAKNENLFDVLLQTDREANTQMIIQKLTTFLKNVKTN